MCSRSRLITMWKKLIVVLSLVLVVHGQFYNDLDTLGERISARVAAQVAPLENLGGRINAQVQQSLRPMQVNLNNRLSELDGLGDKISQQVYDGLEPVRAIELNLKMRDGVGGVTVATHQPGGRQFITKNYRLYTCDSKVDITTGDCPGDLVPFKITTSSPRSDWCYIQSYSLVNNNICLSTGAVSISVIDGQISCTGPNNSPIIQMELDDYKKLCSSVRENTEFRYIPDVNDNRHVAIPNANRYVKCENQQKNLCIFHERNGLLSTYASSGASGIFINNRNGGSSVTYF